MYLLEMFFLHYGKKPDWCPLKSIPQKMADEDGIISRQKEPIECEWDFISGWNACIDEILGEEE